MSEVGVRLCRYGCGRPATNVTGAPVCEECKARRRREGDRVRMARKYARRRAELQAKARARYHARPRIKTPPHACPTCGTPCYGRQCNRCADPGRAATGGYCRGRRYPHCQLSTETHSHCRGIAGHGLGAGDCGLVIPAGEKQCEWCRKEEERYRLQAEGAHEREYSHLRFTVDPGTIPSRGPAPRAEVA